MNIQSHSVRKVIAHVMYFLKKCTRDNIPALAGQSAFFILLSALPFAMFAFSLFSILTGTTVSDVDIPVVNGEAKTFVNWVIRFVETSLAGAASGRAVITAILTLWSAGKGMYCITEGISRVYRLPNKHIWIVKRILAMGYTVVTLLMLVICIGVAMFDVLFARNISEYLGLNSAMYKMLYIFLYLLLGVIQALLMTVALKFFLKGKAEDKRYYSMRALLPGMLITVVAWHLLSIGVMIYLRHFAVSSIYGSLASVMVVMIWIYFLMYILLYGIQFNYIYRKTFAEKNLFTLLKERFIKKKDPDKAEGSVESNEPSETSEPDKIKEPG